MAPEMKLLTSPTGGIIVIAFALAAFLAALAWARRPGHPDRMVALLAATSTTLLVAIFTALSVIAGWVL